MQVDCLVAADFLLDRWQNGDGSAASAYARAHLEDSLAIPWIVKGEFLRAAALAECDSVELLEFLARYPTLWPDEETVIGFGRLGASLRRQSLSLGATESLAGGRDITTRCAVGNASHRGHRQGARDQDRSVLISPEITEAESDW